MAQEAETCSNTIDIQLILIIRSVYKFGRALKRKAICSFEKYVFSADYTKKTLFLNKKPAWK
jgi:hypothetical protein